MKTQIVPTKKMATSCFKNGLKRGLIRKVGPDQYFESDVALVVEQENGDDLYDSLGWTE